jgi:hypothetical protein
MGSHAAYDPEKFHSVFEDLLLGIQGMGGALEEVGDHREVCVLAVLRVFEKYMEELLSAVDNGKKIFWHCGLISPEIFLAFEGMHPYAMEIPFVLSSFLDPDHANVYIDVAEGLGMPPDICGLDKGFLGFTLAQANPPADFVVTPTSPCDSLICGHQVLEKVVDAPCAFLEVPYWQDQRSIDLFSHHIWKLIRTVEEVCNTKLDWDRCKEQILLANETVENFMDETDMRRLSPCPHPGKLGTIAALLNYAAAGTVGARDVSTFILEDSQRLAAEKRGALADEKVRLTWYYPDPFHDLGIHDWMEDEYNAITVVTMFGHTTQTLIDPSTPETIVEGWAWKMMNTTMTRQLRGTVVQYMDDLLTVMKGWNVDAVVAPMALPCKHAHAMQGFIRKACREAEKPLLLLEYDPVDPRPITVDETHNTIAEFMETQVLPGID